MSKDRQSRNRQGGITRPRLRRCISYRALGAVGTVLTTIVPFQVLAAPVTINIADADVAKAITINVGGQMTVAGNGKGVVINLSDNSVQEGVVINIGGATGGAKPVNGGASPAVLPRSNQTGRVTGIPVVAPVAKQNGGTMPTSTFMAVSSPATTSGMHREENIVATTSHSGIATGDMRVRFNELAPDWAQDTLRALARDGRLGATTESDITNSITRKEGAVLTARAYNLLRRQNLSSSNAEAKQLSVNSATNQRIQALTEEFMPELQALGLGSIGLVSDTRFGESGITPPHISGEVRYSYMHNTGGKGNNYNENRWRMRLYGDKQITDQWSVHGLVEFNHGALSETDVNDKARSDENNGKLHLSRLYGEGKYNWFNIPFTIDVGRTYAYLANGTVLDSDLKGVTVTAQPTSNLTINAGHGRVNSTQAITFVEGTQRRGLMDYMAGYYHWNHYDDPVTILYGGLNYYIGNYTLTGQYLTADKKDGSGANDGYQMTVKYGKNFPWIAHTYEFNLDYYDLPGTTYITHTMNGLGNRMNGFTGWGARIYYTLHPDMMISLQYYDLQDKTTKQKGRTLWSEINWGF